MQPNQHVGTTPGGRDGVQPCPVLIVSAEVDVLFVAGLRAARVCVQIVAPGRYHPNPSAPHVVVLDSRSPGFHGPGTVRALRESDRASGIIVIGLLDSHEDTGVLLDAGADDVLVTPICVPQAVARLRALRRRIEYSVRRKTADRPDVTAQIMTIEGIAGRTVLTRTESGVLEILSANAGHVVSRRQLLQSIWGFPGEARSNVLNMCVSSLRRKLESVGAHDFIDTVRGIGYRLRTTLC